MTNKKRGIKSAAALGGKEDDCTFACAALVPAPSPAQSLWTRLAQTRSSTFVTRDHGIKRTVGKGKYLNVRSSSRQSCQLPAANSGLPSRLVSQSQSDPKVIHSPLVSSTQSPLIPQSDHDPAIFHRCILRIEASVVDRFSSSSLRPDECQADFLDW